MCDSYRGGMAGHFHSTSDPQVKVVKELQQRHVDICVEG